MSKPWLPFFKDTIFEPVFRDPYIFKVWMWILSKASTNQRKVAVNNIFMELQPGEALIESRAIAAEFLDLSEGKYRRILDNLEKLGYITKKTTNKYTIINVMKWEMFDLSKNKFDHQMANKKPTNDQQMANKKPIDEQQVNTIKNINNIKNNKNNKNYNNCVPTPKSTKFRNFEPTPDAAVDKEWEKENLKKFLKD